MSEQDDEAVRQFVNRNWLDVLRSNGTWFKDVYGELPSGRTKQYAMSVCLSMLRRYKEGDADE